jgi:hypothetical protein
VALLGSAIVPTAAHAQAVVDKAGDFIPGYTGPKNADLDVITAKASYNGSIFRLDATTAGPIGQTAGGVYVWGFNRGAGTARFGAIAPNVTFDSVIIIDPKGTVTVRDLVTGAATVLPTGSVSVSGNAISVSVPASLLSPQGLKTAQFLANLWPRSGLVGNETISDFAPDNTNTRLLLDFPTPVEASAQTEVVIDGASEHFNQMQGRLSARRDGDEPRYGGFISAGGRFGDRGLGNSAIGDQDTSILSAGVDYAFTSKLVLGLALSADHADVDLASGGELKVRSYSPAAYGAWTSGGFHLEGYAAYTTVEYEARRNLLIGGAALSAQASPDGKAYTGAIAVGYRLGSGAFTFGPIADLVVTRVKVDGYVETNAQDFGSTVQARGRDSARLGLGAQGRYTMERAWGVMALTGKARAVQELADKRDVFQAAFTAQPDVPVAVRGAKTGVTYGAFDLGLTAVTKAGLRVGFTYAPRFDGDGLVDQSALLSIAKRF